ncbi:cryptochrome/photolyase family protein [Psychrobacter raelei]|uniref:cryptochrome/photolyase family protein n=1 Tax=Psychrobacter raelei TaxID=2565531 RepID=UPI003F624D67
MSHSYKVSALMWFRRDLRLHDNTALTLLLEQVLQASQHTESCLQAVFVITPKQWLAHDMSISQVDLMMRTLTHLTRDLNHKLGMKLSVLQAESYSDSIDVIEAFCVNNHITHVGCNYEYEVNEQQRDTALAKRLSKLNIKFNQYHDQCILPPNTIKTGDDTLYKVFTPFYKKWQQTLQISPPVLYDINRLAEGDIKQKLTDLNINQASTDTSSTQNTSSTQHTSTMQSIKDSHQSVLQRFTSHYQLSESDADTILESARADYPAGEQVAIDRLNSFVQQDIEEYSLTRDQPALIGTSHLSAYLTLGIISPRSCYLTANARLESKSFADENLVDSESELEIFENNSKGDVERWISELAWRDFYRHVLVDRPNIVKGAAYKKDTDNKLNWSCDNDDFQAWCQGMTGVPLIDAAMRCLNQTGFMHNRLRMVTAMFLTKDLFIDWRLGERYFMQNLIDGDFASNNGGWQWSASTGTDAAPYFRIMNPFSQAKTHDKDAIFIKSWLPELKDLPANILHDENKLRKALSKQGAFAHVNYPLPMVEHKQARRYAIEQFKARG